MNDPDRSTAYRHIRIGTALIGVAIAVAYFLPYAIAALFRFNLLWFLVSIPVAFLIGGQGLAMIVDGIAVMFRSR
jgi:hypothetical protein